MGQTCGDGPNFLRRPRDLGHFFRWWLYRFLSRQYQRFWVTSCFEKAVRQSSIFGMLPVGIKLLKLGMPRTPQEMSSWVEFRIPRVVKYNKNRDQVWEARDVLSGRKKMFPAQNQPSGDLKPRNYGLKVIFYGLGSDGRWKSPPFTPPFGIIFILHFFQAFFIANPRKPWFLHDFHISEPQWFQPNCWIWWPKPMLSKAIVSSWDFFKAKFQSFFQAHIIERYSISTWICMTYLDLVGS